MKHLFVVQRISDRAALPLLVTGLIGVVGYNWRLWQRDQTLADQIVAERTPTPELVRTPKISALVAAWNEGQRIDDHLRSFEALVYPSIELILIAGGSDDTLERARHYASDRVIVLQQHPGEGKQRALARGYRRATGDLIYLTDADCLFSDDALVRLIAPIVNEGEQAATGTSCPLAEQMNRLLPRYVWSADVMSGVHHPTYSAGLLGRNAAITRAALDLIGGLDFPARTGTDYQLAQRLIHGGINIRYVGASVVPSFYAEDVRTYRHKQSRWLRNLLIHGRRYGAQQDVAVTLRTILIGVAMLLGPWAAVLLGPLLLVLWGLFVLHAVLAKVRYVCFAARIHLLALPKRLILSLLPLTLLDFVVWASPVFDLINPKRREQW